MALLKFLWNCKWRVFVGNFRFAELSKFLSCCSLDAFQERAFLVPVKFSYGIYADPLFVVYFRATLETGWNSL